MATRAQRYCTALRVTMYASDLEVVQSSETLLAWNQYGISMVHELPSHYSSRHQLASSEKTGLVMPL